VQPGRLAQRLGAVRADVVRRVTVATAALQQPLEQLDVQPEPGVGEAGGGPVRRQPAGAERLVQGGECPPQRSSGMLLVVVGPEQFGQHVPAMALRRHRQVGEQRDRLAGVDLDRFAVELHPGRPEQGDSQRSHGKVTSPSDQLTGWHEQAASVWMSG
jgi:hypothetical protein